MKKPTRRILSLFLFLALLIGMLPVSGTLRTFASEAETVAAETEESTEVPAAAVETTTETEAPISTEVEATEPEAPAEEEPEASKADCYNVQPGISLNYANGDNELADRTFGQNAILPFAVYGASDSNPDLILEMEKHLGILFKDQENSNTYQSMKNEIKSIADQARAFGLADNSASSYIKTKEYEYQFLVVLREYIPHLLSKEDFFKEAFK